MKKPLIGSVRRTGRKRCASADAAVGEHVAPARGQAGVVAALDVAAADHEVAAPLAQRPRACRGRRVSSCCRSPSITAMNGAEEASAPSITAEARPRRPMRRMQRTRGSRLAMRRASAAVPSGLSSSTNTTSQAMPAARRRAWRPAGRRWGARCSRAPRRSVRAAGRRRRPQQWLRLRRSCGRTDTAPRHGRKWPSRNGWEACPVRTSRRFACGSAFDGPHRPASQ